MPPSTNPLTLKLDFILYNKGVVLVVNGLGKFGGNGVMSSLVLDNKALVTLHAFEDGGLLHRPGANVCPLLVISLDILLCVRGLPSVFPVVCELFEEGSFELGRLGARLAERGKIENTIAHSKGRLRNRG